MNDKNEAMQQALELIERLNKHGWILADFEDEVYATIDSLKAALEQPDRRALQAAGTHPAPCARHCEAKAFEIEIRSLKSALKQAQPEPPTCAWSPEDDDTMPGTYRSACGELWSFIDGGWQDNNVRFCHGCGGKVEAAHNIKEQP